MSSFWDGQTIKCYQAGAANEQMAALGFRYCVRAIQQNAHDYTVALFTSEMYATDFANDTNARHGLDGGDADRGEVNRG